MQEICENRRVGDLDVVMKSANLIDLAAATHWLVHWLYMVTHP